MFNVKGVMPKKIKSDFPIFERKVEDKTLVYLDSAATSQKPNQVIDAISGFYRMHNANVHRGVHTLSEESTDLYEAARKKVADFIGAPRVEEVIFTKGTTESINRVSSNWAMQNLNKGPVKDEAILIVDSDHHSNIVPWQMVAKQLDVELVIYSLNHENKFDLEKFSKLLDENNIKLVAVSHVSNVLGTIFPIKEICKIAHEQGALVSVDGAQGVPHLKVNMQSLDCDFYSFSGHKMLGPMGIGVLWGKKEHLENMTPYEYGGGMIHTVETNKSTWAELPQGLEAGTPNVAGAIGLAAAIDYLQDLGMDNIEAHEKEITAYAVEKLREVEGLQIIGPDLQNLEIRSGLVSFVIKGMHSHDLATVLASEGVAVRSGQHCTMPLHEKLGIASSTRASFYIYTTKEDIDALITGITKAKEILK